MTWDSTPGSKSQVAHFTMRIKFLVTLLLIPVYPHLYIDLRDRYREFMAEAHYPAGKCTYNVCTLYVQARTYGFGTNNIRNESF